MLSEQNGSVQKLTGGTFENHLSIRQSVLRLMSRCWPLLRIRRSAAVKLQKGTVRMNGAFEYAIRG